LIAWHGLTARRINFNTAYVAVFYCFKARVLIIWNYD